jgi:hypothetical protein
MTSPRDQVQSVSMTLPCPPVTDSDVHTHATERLAAAIADRKHASRDSESSQGGPDERTCAVALAQANDNLAARHAWVHYIEHGY